MAHPQTLVTDDLLGYTKSSANGTFQLIGSDSQIIRVDPMLKIYHDCKNQGVSRSLLRLKL